MHKSVMAIIAIVAVLSLIVSTASATTQVNVTSKSLTITSAPVPQFYGFLTTNNTTSSTYVTGKPGSLVDTLELYNKIKIGINNLTLNGNYTVLAWVS